MMKSSTAFRNLFKCIVFALYQAGKVRLNYTILLLLTPKLEKIMALQMLDSFPGSLLKTRRVPEQGYANVLNCYVFGMLNIFKRKQLKWLVWHFV